MKSAPRSGKSLTWCPGTDLLDYQDKNHTVFSDDPRLTEGLEADLGANSYPKVERRGIEWLHTPEERFMWKQSNKASTLLDEYVGEAYIPTSGLTLEDFPMLLAHGTNKRASAVLYLSQDDWAKWDTEDNLRRSLQLLTQEEFEAKYDALQNAHTALEAEREGFLNEWAKEWVQMRAKGESLLLPKSSRGTMELPQQARHMDDRELTYKGITAKRSAQKGNSFIPLSQNTMSSLQNKSSTTGSSADK